MCKSSLLPGLAAALLTGLAGMVYAQEQDFTATIRVSLKEAKAPIPTTLYGIFMEELSHAFDGGIYAELIQNRGFEEGVLPPGMKLVKGRNPSDARLA